MAAGDFFWNQLLDFIEEGNVVPVVGQGLLRLDGNHNGTGEGEFLYPRLARGLAEYLGMPAAELSPEPTLNEVACRFLDRRDARRDDIYSALKRVMPGDELAVPPSITKLAEIRPFKLFVTTTFDHFLSRALDAVRGAGLTGIQAYSPERVADLPRDWRLSGDPVVFHLLGRVSTDPSYAVTEEDVLEFLHALQSENRRPERLLDHLHQAHLLILGSHFDDWLVRFFLRATVRERLSLAAGTDYFADTRALGNPALVRFLRSFSARTKLFEDGGAIEFVDELHRRWLERHPDGGGGGRQEVEDTGDDPWSMPPGAVFLSYASEDLERARPLRDALDDAGVDVWFDKKHLEWGDRWQPKIRRGIESCAFFLPLVSRHTLSDARRFFRIEWDLAHTEARKAKLTSRFLLPTLLDDTPPDHPDLPESFREAQWQTMSSGEDVERIAAEVRRLVRDVQRRQRRTGR